MAVARIVADRCWFKARAAEFQDQPRMARELLRAAERPGRMAELTSGEVRLLWARRATDRRVVEAYNAILESEARERRAHDHLQGIMRAARGRR